MAAACGAALYLGCCFLLLRRSFNGESGDTTVHIQGAVLGNGPTSALPGGAGSVQGITSGMDRSGLCDTSGAKNNYWWLSCPDDVGGAFTASTCGGARWDTALQLQIPRTDTLSCNDDDPICGMQSTVATTLPPGAGIQVLTVGGTTGDSMGAYALTYTRP